jgi:hypothetical protein
MTPLYIILSIITVLFFLEPEFFALMPEWLTLWWRMALLWVVRVTFGFRLRRQIAKDKKNYEKFIRDRFPLK